MKSPIHGSFSNFTIAIIGAGFSGTMMATRLQAQQLSTLITVELAAADS